MNLKTKIREFFTLSRQSNGGFTLIELIVVIAILAILAGVAVPSYNAYIKMARESADSQLIAAVNTAFASACLENKVEVRDVTNASVAVENGIVKGVASVSAGNLQKINDSFVSYMAGNSDKKFKTEPVNTLMWKQDKGSFEILTLALKYGNAILNAEALAAIVGSNFADMGADELLGTLDDNVDTFAGTVHALYAASNIGSWIGGILGGSWGDKVDGMTTDRVENSLKAGGALDGIISEEKRAEILSGLQSKDTRDTAIAEYSNAMVLLLADKMTAPGVTAATLTQTLKDSDDPSEALSTILGSEGMANTTANAAVSKAMEESFKNSDTYKEAEERYSAYKDFTKSTEYKTAYDNYLKNDEGAKDMEALVGSMQIIKDNKDTIGEDELLSLGINNQSVKDLLNIAITPST